MELPHEFTRFGEILAAFSRPDENGSLKGVVFSGSNLCVIDLFSGEVIRSFSFSKSIRDSVYIPASRLFVVGFDDETLAIVSEEETKLDQISYFPVGLPIFRLICVDSDHIAICSNDSLSLFTISKPSTAKISNKGHQSESRFISACLGSNSIILAVSASKSSSIRLLQFKLTDLISNQFVDVSVAESLDFSLGEAESFSSLHFNKTEASFSLILEKSKKKRKTTNSESLVAGVWIKFNFEAGFFFKKEMTDLPTISFVCDHLMFFYSDPSKFSVWDIKYGIQLQTIDLKKAPSMASFVVIRSLDSITHPYTLVYLSRAKKSTSRIHTLPLRLPNANSSGTLLASIGKSLTQPEFSTRAVLQEKHTEIAPKLADVVNKFENICRSEYQAVFGLTSRFENKVPKHVLRSIEVDISLVDLLEFLRGFASSNPSEILPEYWESVKALILLGRISLSTNQNIIEQAYIAKRLDVLYFIVRFLPDLTEFQTVLILKYCCSMSQDESTSRALDAFIKEFSGDNNQSSEPQVFVLRHFCEAVLLRSIGFSATILSEALLQVSSEFSALLLKIFSHMLGGLCEPITDSAASVHQHTLTDLQIQRVCSWCEALIDAHFPSFSMALAFHNSAADDAHIQSIKSAMRKVIDSYALLGSIEKVKGLWVSLQQVAPSQNNPPKGIYRKELFRFD